MVTVGQLLVLVTLCIGNSSSIIFQENSPYQKVLANYTVSLIEFLASQQFGTFDCWLYHACSDPPGAIRLLQEIYVGLEQKSIPRLATNSRFNWTKVFKEWKPPSLVIVHFEYTSNNISVLKNYGQLLGILDRRTKIILLLSTQSKLMTIYTFIPSFVAGKLYNVAFLSTEQELMIFPDFVQKRFYTFKKFRAFEVMFPDQSRYLHGIPLRYSLVESNLNACKGNYCYGYDVTLVEAMARYLNTTAQYKEFVCPYDFNILNQSIFNCIYNVAYDEFCPFDIFAEPTSFTVYDRQYLKMSIPYDNVFLAPCGRSLNIAELFLRPFQAELWIVFFVGIIAVKVVFLLVPNSFKNDPLLLPICGFERYDLNRAGRTEKLVMLSLIVLFFFISNAYETKIISLMSSKPRVTLVTTLQDILDSGTRVKADRNLAVLYPTFSSVFIYLDISETKEDQLDGISVYLVNGVVGSLLVQRSINWDYESNQPQYKILAEKLAMGIGFYPIPVGSAIKHHLSFVQNALFEAGFLFRWRQEWTAISNQDYFTTLPGGVNPTADILVFSDLIPAWFVVLSGIAMSLFCFVTELCYACLMKSHTTRIAIEI